MFVSIQSSLLAILCAVLLLAPVPAQAAEDFDLKGSACEALNDQDSYIKHKRDSYRFLVPGKDGILFRSSNDFKADFAFKDRAKESFMKIQKAFKSKGTELVLVFPPTRGLAYSDRILSDQPKSAEFEPEAAWASYRAMIKDLNAYGLKVVGVPKIEPGTEFFYKRDHHWSKDGAKITAKHTADFIKAMPVYKTLSQQKFETKIGEEIPFEGKMTDTFAKICGQEIPPETARKIETAPVDQKANAEDIFGDAKAPEVVLVGTSNSVNHTAQANFDGWLKEALSVDVMNAAISGAKVDGSILAYLVSEEYKKNPPKILIWEIPSYYTFGHTDMFRQVIAGIFGSCDRKNLVLETEKEVPAAESFVLFEDIGKKEIATDKYYVQMTFSEPVKKKFHLWYHYHSKDFLDKKRVKFKRTKYYPYDPYFFATVDPRVEKAVTKITMEPHEKMAGLSVKAKICKTPIDF